MNNNGIIRTTAFFVLTVLIVLIMIFAQQILIPLAWALRFAFILFPVCDWMEKRGIGRTWTSLITTIVFSVLSGIVLFYLVYQAVRILQQEGTMLEDVQIGFEQLQAYMAENFGLTFTNSEGNTALSTDMFGKVVNFVAGEISMIGKNLVTITLIPMFLFFLLLYRGIVPEFVQARFHGTEMGRVHSFFHKSRSSIQNYLIGTLILTGITSVMALVILLLFGVRYAFFFSIFIAILNLIPYIGNLAAFVVVLFFVWVTKDNIYTVLLVGLALYGANLIQENFLRPKLIGDKMEMNAMVVFTAVIAGGMIWGFSGMVLFIPLLGVLKALFDSNPKWQAYSIFLTSGKEHEADHTQENDQEENSS